MSATVSACLSLEKYFCSFSNKISYISQRSESMPVPYFEDEGKHHDRSRSQGARRDGNLSAVLQIHHVSCIKPVSIKLRLWTTNCGRWKSWNAYQASGVPNEEHASVKNSSVHVLICQEFEQFAIAKRECLNLALCPWYSLAARLDPSEVGEGVACVQTISPPSRKNREKRVSISSSLLIFSPDFFLRDGRRLYTGKGRRRGGGGGGGGPKYESDRNVCRLSQGMKLPVLGFRTESQYFYLQRYRFNKEISIAVKRYWKMVSEWSNEA